MISSSTTKLSERYANQTRIAEELARQSVNTLFFFFVFFYCCCWWWHAMNRKTHNRCDRGYAFIKIIKCAMTWQLHGTIKVASGRQNNKNPRPRHLVRSISGIYLFAGGRKSFLFISFLSLSLWSMKMFQEINCGLCGIIMKGRRRSWRGRKGRESASDENTMRSMSNFCCIFSKSED